MGFCEALTLIFILLKLEHQIDWDWFHVLLPEIIACSFYGMVGLILLLAWIKDSE